MKFHILLFSVFIIICPLTAYTDKASKLNKNGIESYMENKHEESVQYFTEALVERPDSPELRFNRGTALSAAGKKDEALNELERAANTFEKKDNSAAAHFNAGNTYFASGDLNGAIEEYKKAVKLDQLSQDFRNNLEFALRKLQEQQKQQQEQENKQDKENKEEEKQNGQNRDSEKEEEKENQSQSETSENKDKEQQNEQNQQSQQQEIEQQPMTPEEAQRILDAMNDEEKKAFELRKKMMKEAIRQGDDW